MEDGVAKQSAKNPGLKICLDSISFMDLQSEIDGLPQLMNDIGVAFPSDFTLEQIPSDFMYLNTIFD